jgi:hypothetical protein
MSGKTEAACREEKRENARIAGNILEQGGVKCRILKVPGQRKIY